MDAEKKKFGAGVLAGVVRLLLLTLLVMLFAVYTGYNIAASEDRYALRALDVRYDHQEFR